MGSADGAEGAMLMAVDVAEEQGTDADGVAVKEGVVESHLAEADADASGAVLDSWPSLALLASSGGLGTQSVDGPVSLALPGTTGSIAGGIPGTAVRGSVSGLIPKAELTARGRDARGGVTPLATPTPSPAPCCHICPAACCC